MNGRQTHVRVFRLAFPDGLTFTKTLVTKVTDCQKDMARPANHWLFQI